MRTETNNKQNILLLESYYGGSHKYWADNLIRYSRHNIQLMTLPARKWKWRMQGAAYTFYEMILEDQSRPDIIIASSMIDMSMLISLLRGHLDCSYILYMHENQLTYPLSHLSEKNFDLSYGYQNYKSCLATDAVLFNSHYHKKEFVSACNQLLDKMPDYNNKSSVDRIKNKSEVIEVGLDFSLLDRYSHSETDNKTNKKVKTILWNHRWEYDKNPTLFINLLRKLNRNHQDYKLCITGLDKDQNEKQYQEVMDEFGSHIIHLGYIESYQQYIEMISSTDILIVTSDHDFFGLSVIEAIYCGNSPLLPTDMVYSEYVSDSSLFYHSEEELYDKTVAFLTDTYRNNSYIKNNLRKYDWSILSKTYDIFFERMVTNNKSKDNFE